MVHLGIASTSFASIAGALAYSQTSLTICGPPNRPLHLLIGSTCSSIEARQLALGLNFIRDVPPLKPRLDPREYDRTMYKRRNAVERLSRHLKGFRRIFTPFDKLDNMFRGFISVSPFTDGLRLC